MTNIFINDVNVSEYGLTPLDGTLGVLLKPVGLKKLVTNTNSAFDGVIPIVSANRKRDSRTFTLNFLIRASSLNALRSAVENLESILITGTGGGVNELYVPEIEQCYRVIFDGITTFNAIKGKAVIAIKFIEFCPTAENREPENTSSDETSN